MSMSLLLGRLRHLSPPLPLFLTPPFATSTQAPSPIPRFDAEYLIHSCGLPSDEAVRVYHKIQHLKSPVKPDSVLRFLRQIGIRESDIRTAVSRDPRLLCSHVEKNWIPNVAKLQEVGLSIEEISGIISRSPNVFLFNFAPKVDFWMGVLGSAENLSLALKRSAAFLNMNLENVAMPNLSFLKEQCGLSARQIVQLIRWDPRLITSSTETLKMKAERADQLGVPRTSGTFLHALIIVSRNKQCTIDSKLNNLRRLGFSQEEVTVMIGKSPRLLALAEEVIARKMEFLMKEADCDKSDLVRNPILLMYSLENRLIPRNVVRKLLMSRGLLGPNQSYFSLLKPSDKQFVEKYILPYEHAIPGLHHAYADA